MNQKKCWSGVKIVVNNSLILNRASTFFVLLKTMAMKKFLWTVRTRVCVCLRMRWTYVVGDIESKFIGFMLHNRFFLLTFSFITAHDESLLVSINDPLIIIQFTSWYIANTSPRFRDVWRHAEIIYCKRSLTSRKVNRNHFSTGNDVTFQSIHTRQSQETNNHALTSIYQLVYAM